MWKTVLGAFQSPTTVAPVRIRMVRKLATKTSRAVYARRKRFVEHVFGQIKEARGLRRFPLRGPQELRGK